MSQAITEQELAGRADALLEAVERGETFIIVRDGRAMAELRPISSRRPSGVPLDVIRARFAGLPRVDYQAMRADIDEFFGDDDRIRDEDYE